MVNVHGRQRIDYTHKAKQVMRVTREIKLVGGDTIPEGALVYVESRNQGYNCLAVQPAFFPNLRFRLVNCSDLEEISVLEWIEILNPEISKERYG